MNQGAKILPETKLIRLAIHPRERLTVSVERAQAKEVAATCWGDWGVHDVQRPPRGASEQSVHWTVTHVPTGYAVIHTPRLDDAHDLAQLLSAEHPRAFQSVGFGGTFGVLELAEEKAIRRRVNEWLADRTGSTEVVEREVP